MTASGPCFHHVPSLNPISNAERRKLSTTCRCAACARARRDVLDQSWELSLLPRQVRALVAGGRVDLRALARLWSAPALRDFTRSERFAGYGGASWFLALGHLRLGMVPEARALALNGFYIEQCAVSIVA